MDDRVNKLAGLLRRLIDGDPSQTIARDLAGFKGVITAQELALAEEQLIASGTAVDEIQRANQLHAALVLDDLNTQSGADMADWSPGHPAYVFMGENEGIRGFLSGRLQPDLDAFLASSAEKDRQNLLSAGQELQIALNKHYERKENLLFPYLEKAGITVPPQVMWGVDDVIRNLLNLFVETISQTPVNSKRLTMIFERFTVQVEQMIVKENHILLPMLKPHMSEEDWLLVARESSIIGYALNKGVEGASNSDAMTWLQNATHEGKRQTSSAGTIELPSGQLSLAQLTAMLNTLPTDLTFIDHDDIIRYYSEGKHQVFTRTRTIIGRDVYLCHPPQLVPVIRKLIEAFRGGSKDEEVVLVRKGSRLNLVRYYAVRDDAGQYVGTVEVTEEISEIVEKAVHL